MIREGGCQCGATRYRIDGNARFEAVCHCADCRASAGAPMVAWFCAGEEQVTLLSGDPVTYRGKSGAERQFCPTCGTGLFYRNAAILPGLVDVQSATFDDAEMAAPQLHVQCAERIGWLIDMAALPEYERYPAA